MQLKRRQIKGFTLVEMLVVLFIISMLVVLITPNLIGARDRAKDAAKREEMVTLKNALRLYYNDNAKYPDSPDGIAPPVAVLNAGNYLPSGNTSVMSGIGYSKVNSETFYLFYFQESKGGEEAANSRANCGIGTTEMGDYVICVK